MIFIAIIRVVILITFFLLLALAVVAIIILPRYWEKYLLGHLDHETRIAALERRSHITGEVTSD